MHPLPNAIPPRPPRGSERHQASGGATVSSDEPIVAAATRPSTDPAGLLFAAWLVGALVIGGAFTCWRKIVHRDGFAENLGCGIAVGLVWPVIAIAAALVLAAAPLVAAGWLLVWPVAWLTRRHRDRHAPPPPHEELVETFPGKVSQSPAPSAWEWRVRLDAEEPQD